MQLYCSCLCCHVCGSIELKVICPACFYCMGNGNLFIKIGGIKISVFSSTMLHLNVHLGSVMIGDYQNTSLLVRIPFIGRIKISVFSSTMLHLNVHLGSVMIGDYQNTSLLVRIPFIGGIKISVFSSTMLHLNVHLGSVMIGDYQNTSLLVRIPFISKSTRNNFM